MPHVISALRPGWAVPGAPVSIEGVHLPVPAGGPPHVLVGARDAHVIAASHRTLRIAVPPDAEGGTAAVRIDELPGETIYLEVARAFVSGVHQVDNPAFGPDGLLYCTMSGSRDTKAAVPLYRVRRDGGREPIAVEIANPTSLAVGPDRRLYVSSRFEGVVYRLLEDDRVELYATELGDRHRPGVRVRRQPVRRRSLGVDSPRVAGSARRDVRDDSRQRGGVSPGHGA